MSGLPCDLLQSEQEDLFLKDSVRFVQTGVCSPVDMAKVHNSTTNNHLILWFYSQLLAQDYDKYIVAYRQFSVQLDFSTERNGLVWIASLEILFQLLSHGQPYTLSLPLIVSLNQKPSLDLSQQQDLLSKVLQLSFEGFLSSTFDYNKLMYCNNTRVLLDESDKSMFAQIDPETVRLVHAVTHDHIVPSNSGLLEMNIIALSRACSNLKLQTMVDLLQVNPDDILNMLLDMKRRKVLNADLDEVDGWITFDQKNSTTHTGINQVMDCIAQFQ